MFLSFIGPGCRDPVFCLWINPLFLVIIVFLGFRDVCWLFLWVPVFCHLCILCFLFNSVPSRISVCDIDITVSSNVPHLRLIVSSALVYLGFVLPCTSCQIVLCFTAKSSSYFKPPVFLYFKLLLGRELIWQIFFTFPLCLSILQANFFFQKLALSFQFSGAIFQNVHKDRMIETQLLMAKYCMFFNFFSMCRIVHQIKTWRFESFKAKPHYCIMSVFSCLLVFIFQTVYVMYL